MILPECREMWNGIERADSLLINPHKWLGSAFDCSLYYVRDAEHLVRVMSTNPSYLRTAADGQVRNYARLGDRTGPALPCIEAVVLDSLRRCRGPADTTAARHRQCPVARGASEKHASLAGGCPGSASNRVRRQRTTRPCR